MSAPKLNRTLHRYGAILFAAPLLVVICSGVLLQLKKEWAWVQPPTMRGSGSTPSVSWDAVLAAVRSVPEAEVESWDDIDRLDVRPSRGVLKVRCHNHWEVQLDAATADMLSSTYRRSDLIESIHDGSWFHERVKLWLFLPTAAVLLGLWGTGIYLWLLPLLVRRRRKRA
jgi:uncharacterized iron-regulated membrane protein